jgi:large subunit ribosomal protein L20
MYSSPNTTQKNQIISPAIQQKKNILKQTKGFRGRSKNCFRVAIRRLHKSWQYAYRDRRRKRREWSKLWIQRISAGVRQYSWSYSQFMGRWKQKMNQSTSSSSSSSLKLDRKILAELAANEPFAFRSVLQVLDHVTKKSQ